MMRDPQVLPCDEAIIDAVHARRGYVIAAQGPDGDERITGAAVVLRHYGENPAVESPWREIIPLRVAPAGFGLRKVVLAAATVSEAVLSPGAEALVTVVPQAAMNEVSQSISVGFAPWRAPAALMESWLQSRHGYLSPNAEAPVDAVQALWDECHLLAVQSDGISQLAYSLLRWDQPDSLLVRPASREHGAAQPAALRLSLDCLRSHRSAIQSMAQVNYSYQRMLTL